MRVCLLLLLAAGPASAADDQALCPEGQTRVATNDDHEPFRCVPLDKPSGPFLPVVGSFNKGLRCPKGYAALATPGQMRRWRCVARPKQGGDPDISPAPRQAQPQAKPPPPPVGKAPTDYARYTIPGSLQVDYPRGWHVTNGWGDEVPTLYFEYDTGRQGKQVTLVVTRVERGQYGYVDLPAAMEREREWQNAAEEPPGRAGGLPARFTVIAGESRTAYVPLRDDAYLTLGYSAPPDLFSVYEPAFQRLLDSLRLSRRR